MKSWIQGLALLVAISGSFWLGHVVAQDGKDDPMPMGEMPPWMKKTEEHAKLQESTGTWHVEAQMFMGPEPMPFTGVAKRKSILGGNFVEETFTCDFMGQPFEGRMIEGYDPIQKEYVGVWVDSSTPYMQVSRGKMKDGVLTMRGKGVDSHTGKIVEMMYMVKEESDDEATMTMYQIGEDGEKTKTMHMVYRRKK